MMRSEFYSLEFNVSNALLEADFPVSPRTIEYYDRLLCRLSNEENQ
jgi:hypothetical protein